MPDLVAVAKAALVEITPEATIGAHSGQVEEAGATTVTFQANMSGYPGWHWTVSIATLDDAEPSVLEVELMPGNGALLAPDWVPWSERLADYEAAQEALSADENDDELEGSELESDDSDEDESDDDDDDDDDLGSDVLHGGDLDGVDIDELGSDDDDDDDDEDEDLDLAEDDQDADDEDDDLAADDLDTNELDADDAEDERSY